VRKLFPFRRQKAPIEALGWCVSAFDGDDHGSEPSSVDLTLLPTVGWVEVPDDPIGWGREPGRQPSW